MTKITDKPDYRSKVGYCLALNVIQQSGCKNFLASVAPNKYCQRFKAGQCELRVEVK